MTESVSYQILPPSTRPRSKKHPSATRFVAATFIASAVSSDLISADPSHRLPTTPVSSNCGSGIFHIRKVPTISFSEQYTEKEKMLRRLHDLFNALSLDGWDGYGAVPIERESYLNARKVVMATPYKILKLWNVFPSPNGTISLEFKDKKISAMSIGNEDFSYVAVSDSGATLMDQLPFDENSAADALIAMSKMFGYSI